MCHRPLLGAIGGVTEFRRNEKLDARGFGPQSKSLLGIESIQAEGRDDNIKAGEGFSEGGRVVVVNGDNGGTLLGELFRLRIFGRLTYEEKMTATLSHGSE